MSEARAAEPRGALRVYLRDRRLAVNAALECVLASYHPTPETLAAGMRHALFAGGKRLRPLLVIAATEACGGDAETVMPAACALELIHTYSLVHDDLPAFDDEALRRGQPTCHVIWGEAEAILVGDALQALAFEQLAAGGIGAQHPRRWLRASRVIAVAAGPTGMCGGQMRDIQAAGQAIDLGTLRDLHAAKTGALLTAAVVSGAILAGADDDRVEQLRQYGDAVGLAFQVVDDLLDVEGDEHQLGKRPGGDADRSQPTFPSLLGLDATRAESIRLRDQALSALADFGESADPLRELADYVIARSS